MASLRYYSVIYRLINVKDATVLLFYTKSTLAPLQIQPSSVITSSQGQNTLCRYNESLSLCEVYTKSEGKIFQDKVQACRHIA